MNKYDIAAMIEVMGIAGQRVKMSAAQQREIFGAVIFGKQNVQFDLTGQGMVEVTRNTSGPTSDLLFNQFSLDEVVAAAQTGKELRA